MRIKNWVARVSAANIDFKYKGKCMFRLVLIGVITTWNYYFFSFNATYRHIEGIKK